MLLWGIVFEVAFAAMVVTLPPLREVFGTAPPPAGHLAVLAVFPVVVWGADELRRLVLRTRKLGGDPVAGGSPRSRS